MAYPFVPAYYQYGTRKGPALGFVIHMAEGGGTVGYLSRANPNHVSVHYVIEYGGRIVQMVHEADASGSINPRDVRTTDDADGFFGYSSNRAVLGAWWADPNSAVISLEIEGFASTGPNPSQRAALGRLVTDVRSRHPDIGLLGHRDFADYKACPGRLIPWTALGGHGPAHKETEDMGLVIGQLSTSPGTLRVKGTGHSFIVVGTGELVPVPDLWPGEAGKQVLCRGVIAADFKTPGGAIIHKGVPVFTVGDTEAAFLEQDVTFTPTPPVVSCDDVVAAELRAAAQRVLTRG